METVLPSLPNEVTVVPLEKRVFNHELISNGKVTAKDYADLYFRTAEVVAHVWVKNGDVVRKGQKIAELDLFKLNNTLAQQKNGLAQSTLEMQDVLIGQGYAPDNLKAVPADVLELAKVKVVMSKVKPNMSLPNMMWNKLHWWHLSMVLLPISSKKNITFQKRQKLFAG